MYVVEPVKKINLFKYWELNILSFENVLTFDNFAYDDKLDVKLEFET